MGRTSSAIIWKTRRIVLPARGRRKEETSMATKQAWQALLLFIAGSLIGLGLLALDLFFISIPCIMIGLGLAIFGNKRWGNHSLWTAFLGFGMVPALFLLNNIIRSFPTCPPGGLTLPADAPAGTTVSCGGPIPATSYILLACFGVVVLGAFAWPLLRRHAHR
jgi:hypothetical protein